MKRDFGTADACREELFKAGHSMYIIALQGGPCCTTLTLLTRTHAYACHARMRTMLTMAELPTKVGVEIWESHGERMWRARDGRSGPRPNHEGKII